MSRIRKMKTPLRAVRICLMSGLMLAAVSAGWLAAHAQEGDEGALSVDGQSEIMMAKDVLGALLPIRGIPNRTVAFPLVEFEFSTTSLTPRGQAQLNQIGMALANPLLADFRYLVIGHTDNVGEADYNQKLSEARAVATNDYLISKFGLNASRFELVGKGETEPFDPSDPGHSMNRRVEFKTLDRVVE